MQSDWVNSWSLERPSGNAGVLCGPDSGVLVIDVDTPDAAAQYAQWGLPETFTVLSGRGGVGRHFYFRWPAGLERVPNRLDGVEVKGTGRQVVAWDSLHQSGNLYSKLGGQFAELPGAFVERLRGSTPQHSIADVSDATADGQRALESLLAVLPDATELRDGNWEATCPAHADRDPSLVVTASGDRLLVHCRAGCTYQEVVAALDWAPPAATFDPQSDLSGTELLQWTQLNAKGLGTRFKLTDLVAAQLGSVRWAVPDMIPDGLTLLAGPPKLGKSWLVLDLAIQVAAGGRFLDIAVEQGDALYLALEDNARRLQGRARMLLADRPAPERLELWTRAGKLGTDLIPDIESWLDAHPEARLVIIDTLGRVQDAAGGDSGDGGYADAVTALAALQDVAANRGVAVVVITHTKKGGWSANGDPLEAVLGSQGYAGTADSILVLKRDRGDDAGELFITGREITDETTLELTFSDETCRWALGGELTTTQKIMAAVEAEPYKRTKNWLAKNVKARKGDALAEIDALVAAGRLAIGAAADGGKTKRYGLPIH